MRGLFITLEGCEAAGKSTQAALLLKYFKKRGKECILLREPGSTLAGEKIRNIIIDKEMKLCDTTEVMLYAAARAQIVSEKIIPAINSGTIVICDRFLDSSVAYQGYGRKIGLSKIYDINKYATDDISPDITFFIDIEPESSFSRKGENESLDRIELLDMDFHKRVYFGYKRLLEKAPERIFLINGEQSPEQINTDITNILERKFNGRI